MQLLDIEINGTKHYAVSDPADPSGLVHDFGPGIEGFKAAVEFQNLVYLAEHSAFCAGFAL